MKTATVTLVRGATGIAIYINDYRVAGPKPLGGGIAMCHWDVDERDIDTALHRGEPAPRKPHES